VIPRFIKKNLFSVIFLFLRFSLTTLQLLAKHVAAQLIYGCKISFFLDRLVTTLAKLVVRL